MPRHRSFTHIIVLFFIWLFVQTVLCRTHKKGMSTIEGKIVQGEPVPIEKFPHMVQFFNSGDMCAGAIISSWAVMTAAHCFTFNRDVDEMEIHAGARYTYDTNAKIYEVWYIVTHEDYSKVMQFSCDIALIFLREPIEFSKKVRKAVLANTNAWMVQGATNFSATGWGQVQYVGPISQNGLLTTSLHFIPLDKCGKMHNLTMSKDMFCLYGNGVHDTCKGDSGGGIMWHGMVVGIVSHGDGCAQKNKPSVYANVWYLGKWIKKKMFDFQNTFCNRSVTDGVQQDSGLYDVQCAMEGRIVEGLAAPIEKFPFAVQIFNCGSLCGGSILSSWAVLTAAHCFNNNKDIKDIHVRFGARYTYDMTAEAHDIWYFVEHEDYNKAAPFACDIALVFTSRPIEFMERAKKALLVNSDRWMNEKEYNFTATGWGYTSQGGKISNDGLMETYLNFVPRKKCEHMNNHSKLTEDMFCLYGDGVRDTCQGDSGGAILWHGLIVGIVSHGEGCALEGKPGVYTNVYHFLSWIKKKIRDSHKKYCILPPIEY